MICAQVFSGGIGLSDARYNLDVGSGRHGEQTGKTWRVDVNSSEDIRQDYGAC